MVGYDEGGRGCGEVSAEKLIVARFRLHPSANVFLPHYPTLPPFELTSVPGSRLPPRRVHYSEVQYTLRQTPNQPARGRYGQLLEGLRRRVRRMMSSREAPSGPVRLPSARTPQSRPPQFFCLSVATRRFLHITLYPAKNFRARLLGKSEKRAEEPRVARLRCSVCLLLEIHSGSLGAPCNLT